MNNKTPDELTASFWKQGIEAENTHISAFNILILARNNDYINQNPNKFELK